MNTYMLTLYNDLMALCASNEAFYFVDQTYDGDKYRVFTYRLASYTDFLLPNALECRGHTFRLGVNDEPLYLASLPPAKFFNISENPMTMDLDFSKTVGIMDKLDGSLISTVSILAVDDGSYFSEGFFLKSKTSFTSEHALEATRLLNTPEYEDLQEFLYESSGWTVNMELLSPTLRIVIGYDKPTLKILNIRDNVTGQYIPRETFMHESDGDFVERYWVKYIECDDPVTFVPSIVDMEDNIEGYIIVLDTGQMVKQKTRKYALLHHTKDSVNSPRRLFEACVYEQSDDLRAMFATDPYAVVLINAMQEKVAHLYNHIHKTIHEYYEANKEMDRKTYALAGQANSDIMKHGVFGLVMNLYQGKSADVKAFLVKNYKSFGIKDDPEDLTIEE